MQNELIKTGSKFDSFKEFEMMLEHWKAEMFHPFRVASSETLRMPDGSTNETFKYRYIVYHCAHYGSPRMRGVGKRPNQNYMPCGCRAMLRLNYSWTENALRVTTLNVQHTGHDISADHYSRFASKAKRHCSGFSTPRASPSNNENNNNMSDVKDVVINKMSSSASSSPMASDSSSFTTSVTPSSVAVPVPVVPVNHNFQHQRRLLQLDSANRLYHQQQQLLLATQQHQHQQQQINSKEEFPTSVGYLPATVAGALLELYCQQQQSLYANLAAVRMPPVTPPITAAVPAYERVAALQPILHSVADHLLNVSGEEFDEKLKSLKLILSAWRNAKFTGFHHNDNAAAVGMTP